MYSLRVEEDSNPRRFGPAQKLQKIQTQEDLAHIREDSALLYLCANVNSLPHKLNCFFSNSIFPTYDRSRLLMKIPTL